MEYRHGIPVSIAAASLLLAGACGEDGGGEGGPALGEGESEGEPLPPAGAWTIAADPEAALSFSEVGEAGGVDWEHRVVGPGAYLTNFYDHGCGMAVGDFDGDGNDDLFLLNQCGPSGYYLGNGDGTFQDRSELVAMLDDRVRVGVTFGDYDEDGDVDFFVATTRGPNALLRQEDDGSFTDVSAEAGVQDDDHFTGAAFVDVDRDGDLDLVVAATGQYTNDNIVDDDGRCQPYREGADLSQVPNLGHGTSRLYMNGGAGGGYRFTDEAEPRGFPIDVGTFVEPGWFGDAIFADYDRDGDPDIILSDMFGTTKLLDNDGDGFFTEVNGTDVLPRTSWGTVAAVFADYDNDGWLDLSMTDMHSDMWVAPDLDFDTVDDSTRHTGPNGPDRSGVGDNPQGAIYGNSLWISRQGESFEEVGLDWGFETFQPWGHMVADFDNDGDMDVFIPSGMSNPFDYWPNQYLENRGDGFAQRQGEVGFDPPPGGGIQPDRRDAQGQPYVSAARTGATLDFDNDGDLDLIVQMWENRVHVWRNDLASANHWLQVELAGRAPKSPFGAMVQVRSGDSVMTRWLNGPMGYLSQSAARVHFGLGTAAAIDDVTVVWPDGTQTVVASPGIDRRIVVEQE